MSRTGSAVEEDRTTENVANGTTPGQAPPERTVDAEAASRVTVIRPASRIPRLAVGELWHYRELLWTLVWRDVAVRYKQTFLGIAWAILVPAFTALIYVVIFGKFANFPAGETPYPSLVVAGVLPMQYFASALTPREPEPAREPPARHEGLLPAHAAAALGRHGAARRLRDRPADPARADGPLRHVAGRVAGPHRAALHAARRRDRPRSRPAALGDQRPLPRRALHDPRLPPGAAPALGRHVRGRPDPREVAADPLLQPDDRGDRRLALGDARRGPARPGASRDRRRASPSRCSSPGLAAFRASEPRFADTI